MPTTKRKKVEKVYSYYEYAQKFRPKSLPKEEKDLSSEPACLAKLVLDEELQDETQPPADPQDAK